MSNRKLKFYSVNDLATDFEFERFVDYVSDFNSKEVEKITDINELLELYNVLLFVQEVLIKNAETTMADYNNFSRKSRTVLKNSVVNSENYLLREYKKLVPDYEEDFWGMMNNYGHLGNIHETMLEELLTERPNSIRYALNWKYARKKFGDVLLKMFSQNSINVQLIVDTLERQSKVSYIPPISSGVFNRMIDEYIDNPKADYTYLKKLSHWKSRGKLSIDLQVLNRISQKVQAIESKYFKGGHHSTHTLKILPFIDKPKDFISVKNEGVDLTIMVNQDVLDDLTSGIDYLEFLRNWPFLFSKYETFAVVKPVDNSGSLFSRLQKQFEDEYDIDNLNLGVGLISIRGFEDFRSKGNKKSMLESIEEFVNGLKENYGVTDFEVQLSSNESPYYTRLKIILPEIEKLINYFEVFKMMGKTETDDLKRIGVNKSGFTSAKSIYDTKFYEPVDRSVLNMLFKKRTMEDSGQKWTVASQLGNKRNLSGLKHQKLIMRELVKLKLIDEQSNKSVLSTLDLSVLERVWYDGYTTYFGLTPKQKVSARNLVDMGLLVANGNLFSSEEVQFISYVLDDKKYSNGLSVRNSILHGNISSRDEQFNQSAYYVVLLVLLLVTVRLKDEFEFFTELEAQDVLE